MKCIVCGEETKLVKTINGIGAAFCECHYPEEKILVPAILKTSKTAIFRWHVLETSSRSHLSNKPPTSVGGYKKDMIAACRRF